MALDDPLVYLERDIRHMAAWDANGVASFGKSRLAHANGSDSYPSLCASHYRSIFQRRKTQGKNDHLMFPRRHDLHTLCQDGVDVGE